MSILRRLLCLCGRHERSRRLARRTEAGWRSQCRHCGKAMLKLHGGDWRVAIVQPVGGATTPAAAHVKAKDASRIGRKPAERRRKKPAASHGEERQRPD